MNLYNTLSKTIETFKPLNPPLVTFYSCGPTVYDFTHIGHIRTFINCDVLKRVLIANGYKVKHVMNITDVGHLTNDSDSGDDKFAKTAKRDKKTVWEVAQFYTDYFFYTMKQVNIINADIISKATEHIEEMIEFIKGLENKNCTYETKQAIYFNTAKVQDYGKLTGQKLDEKKVAVRDEVVLDPDKKNPTDFVLWFKKVGKYNNHSMSWDSPWGTGFPGWHIECSAMSQKYLGDTIDIHAGGVDHIPVHHTNEIAQSESLTGKPFVNYWMHNEFLLVDGKKMSKSLDNFYTIDDIKNNGFDPLSLRYLFLQSHYRKQMNFTFDSLSASEEGLKNLRKNIRNLKNQSERSSLSEEKLAKIDMFRSQFLESINSDLNTSKALSIIPEVLKSNIPASDKYDLLIELDQILGLDLNKEETINKEISKEIEELFQKRNILKNEKKYIEADKIRNELLEKGYLIEDLPTGSKIIKK